MKSLFRGHFNLSEAEFKTLWEECVFSFDTNVLLDLYRYREESADAMLAVLEKLRERDQLWLPYQVASEFFRHRDEEIKKQFPVYDKVKQHLEHISVSFKKEFPRHAMLPMDAYASRLEEVARELAQDIATIKDNHQDVTDTTKDATLETLARLFDGRVGKKPSDEQAKKQLDESKKRADADLRPYNKESDDAKKPGDRKYGDTIVWIQLLDHCHQQNKALILITSEKKPDWWNISVGQRIGPQREMVQEFHECTGKLYHLYMTDSFLKYAGEYVGIAPKPDVIEDVRAVEKQRQDEEPILNLLGQYFPRRQSPFGVNHPAKELVDSMHGPNGSGEPFTTQQLLLLALSH